MSTMLKEAYVSRHTPLGLGTEKTSPHRWGLKNKILVKKIDTKKSPEKVSGQGRKFSHASMHAYGLKCTEVS